MSQIEIVEAGAVRPDRAARQFVQALQDDGLLGRTWRVRCELHGGAGLHRNIGAAVLLGLEGEDSDGFAPEALARRLRRIHDSAELRLLGTRRIAFDRRRHLASEGGGAPDTGATALRLAAFDPGGSLLLEMSCTVAHAG
jgi:L-serine dehydratase